LQGFFNALVPVNAPAQSIEDCVIDDSGSFFAALAIKIGEGCRNAVLFELP
jgi:hypothetical protein